MYSAKAVRFTFSCGRFNVPTRLEEPVVQWDDLWDGGHQWTQGFQTTSETFAMQRRDELQVFTFKEPILCVGGLFKVKCWAHFTRGPAQDCLIATSSSPHAQLSHPAQELHAPHTADAMTATHTSRAVSQSFAGVGFSLNLGIKSESKRFKCMCPRADILLMSLPAD